MNEPPAPGLDVFQGEVAQVALRAIAGQGFALAGSGALAAHGLINRPTADLDLFSPTEGGPGQVSAALQTELTAAGFGVVELDAADQHAGEFLRLRVERGAQSVDIDVARDWRLHAPVRLPLGPVLHLEDAVASKVTAMIGRGLPRDFIDVAAALTRYDRSQLLHLAFYRDPGLRVEDVTYAMQRLDRLPDAPFLDYALSSADVRQVRLSFQDWPRDPTQDAPARQVHAAAQRAGKTAAGLASAGFPTPLNETLQQRDVKSPLFPGPLSPGRSQPPSAIADTERGRS